jgi:peptidoglycan/LPS O-acetylase OafA/YrhL
VKFRADIQGLRALAVLLVIAHHFFPKTITGGFFGVDIFFVISGYIITLTLNEQQRNSLRKSLLEFYARRVRRILPSALAVILLSVVFTYLLLGSITASDTAVDGIFAALFLANIHFNSSVVDYFASGLPQPILQHYWSLAIEEQFYLIWPLLFFISKKQSIRLTTVILLSITSLIFAITSLLNASPTAYLSTLTRAWELGIGAIVALSKFRFSSSLLSYISLFFLIVLSTLYTPESDFPGLPALVIALLACVVIINSDSNRVLASKVMMWIGDRSYTLYLVHWSVFQIAFLYRGSELLVIQKLALILLITAISAILFRYLEDPMRHSEKLINKPHSTLTLGFGASTVTILLLISLRSLV